VVGVKNLGEWVLYMLNTPPFLYPGSTSRQVWYMTRFARWRSEVPRQEDTDDVPLELFTGLCRNLSHAGVLAVCLREIHKSLVAKDLTGAAALDCLSGLLTTKREARYTVLRIEVVRMEVFKLATAALCDIEKVPNTLPLRSKTADAIADLFDIYRGRGALTHAWPSQVDSFFRALLSHSMVHVATAANLHSRFQMLQLLQHPSIRSMWRDRTPCTYDGQLILLVLNLMDPVDPAYTELYSWDNMNPSTELMELTIATVRIATTLPGNLSHGSFERQSLLELLNTLAMSLHYGVGNMDEEEAYHLLPVAPTDRTINPFPWMRWLLSSFKAEMHDPTFSSLITTMMSIWVRIQFHRTLYRPPNEEEMAQLIALEEPLLIFLGSGLLGWDYAPDDDDPVWETPLWKLAVHSWCLDSPDDIDAPCSVLLLAISRRQTTFFDKCVLDYLQRRVERIVSHLFT
jgi:hypothetical protein